MYALNYITDKHKESLQIGIRILSFLMNEESKEAKLAAIKAAYNFDSDPRIVDWIGSMLISETDQEVCECAFKFLIKHVNEMKQFLLAPTRINLS